MPELLDRFILWAAGGLAWMLYEAHRPLARASAAAHNRRCARLRRRWHERSPF